MSSSLTLIGESIVAQLIGVKSKRNDPTPSLSVLNATAEVDLYAGDIGCTWDMGDGRVAYGFGDVAGSYYRWWYGTSQFGGHSTTAKGILDTNLASSNFDPAFASAIVGLNGNPGFDTSGYLSIQTGTGPDGWATIYYNGIIHFGTGDWRFTNCYRVAGGGTITAGMAVADGDPTSGKATRGNLIAVSGTVGGGIKNITAGVDDLTFAAQASGKATESFPFTLTTNTWSDVYGTSTFHQIAAVARDANGYITVTTSSAHGIADNGWGWYNGPNVYIGGVNSTSALQAGGSDVSTFAGSGVLTLAAGWTNTNFVSGGAASPANRIAVQTTTGWAILSYTAKGSGTFTGCTLISGSGTTVVNGQVIQGIEDLNDRILRVFDVVSTTKFRVIGTAGARDGGTLQSLCGCLVPANPQYATPTTADRDGNFPVGGFAVPRASSYSGWRQFCFVYNQKGFPYNGTLQSFPQSLDVYYSDSDIAGASPGWTYAFSFPNGADMNSAFQGCSAYYDAGKHQDATTAYVYLINQPGLRLMRWDPADLQGTGGSAPAFSTIKHWNASGSTWSATASDGTHLGWKDTINRTIAGPLPSANGSFLWMDALSEWVYSYGDGGLQMAFRAATDLKGPWTTQRSSTPALSNASLTPPETNLPIYSGYVDPRSGHAPNDTTTLHRTLTIQGPYNVWQVASKLYEPPGGVVTVPEIVDTEMRYRSGGQITAPLISAPLFQDSDGWVQRTSAWTRSSNTVFVCSAGTAWVSGTSYVPGDVVVSVNVTYRCTAKVSGATAPASDLTHWRAFVQYAAGTSLRWAESGVVKYGWVASESISTTTRTVTLNASSTAMAATPDTGSEFYSPVNLAMLTTKGDVLVASGSGAPDRLAVGAFGTVLKADSVEADGLIFGQTESLRDKYLKPTGTWETFPRYVGTSELATGINGFATLVGIALPKNLLVTNIAFYSGATAIGTPTHWWFALCNSSGTTLRSTADQTSTAWALNTRKSIALSSTFTTAYEGLYYLAIMTSATTQPTLACSVQAGTVGAVLNLTAPKMAVYSTTSGMTGAQADATALGLGASGLTARLYAEVS